MEEAVPHRAGETIDSADRLKMRKDTELEVASNNSGAGIQDLLRQPIKTNNSNNSSRSSLTRIQNRSSVSSSTKLSCSCTPL